MNSIKLNLINRSNDANNSQIVIFQKNENADWNETSIAWYVIRNLGQNNYHPFEYSLAMTVSADDSYGNHTPQMAAENGQLFSMTMQPSGTVLAPAGSSTNPTEVQCWNALDQGSIAANVYKGGRLLARVPNIVPGEQAVFQFLPKIYMSVLSNVQQGTEMNSADVTRNNVFLDLTGLASADIIMEGGGKGETATAYRFRLENKVLAS
jgi:hypothetical protein